MAPCPFRTLRTEVEREGNPDRAAGETAAKESAGAAAEKRERRNNKTTLKEDDQ